MAAAPLVVDAAAYHTPQLRRRDCDIVRPGRVLSASRLPTASDDPLGASRYTFVKGDTLGSGTFSTVYRGFDTVSDTPVAIKHLLSTSRDEARPQKQSLSLRYREVTVDWRLKHDNIMSLLDSFMIKTDLYLVMEPACGGDLFVWINACVARAHGSDEFLTDAGHQASVHTITSQVARALSYAHDHGTSHRDVKPENILIMNTPSEPWHVKVADWGFAFRTGIDAESARQDRLGTPIYVAPEVLYTDRYALRGVIDPYVADAWSLGVIAYTLAHLETPIHSSQLFANPFPGYTRIMLPINPHIGDSLIGAVSNLLLIHPTARCTVATALRYLDGSMPSTPSVRRAQVLFDAFYEEEEEEEEGSDVTTQTSSGNSGSSKSDDDDDDTKDYDSDTGE